MVPLTDSFSDSWPSNVKAHLDDIERKFFLDEAELKAITKQFLEDFHQGLSEYGHPMAMM